MSTDVAGPVGLDLGLDRTFDLSREAVRARTVRRRLSVVVTLVVGVGGITAAHEVWPGAVDRPVLPLPVAATVAGLGLMVLAVVVMLVGIGTMVRAGSNPFDNHDPLRDLPRDDRAWARARVAAGAPVTAEQHAIVVAAAGWMARQRGTAPLYLGLVLEGLGFTISGGGILNLLVGLVLVVEGGLLLGLALSRARSARQWLTLYA